jgi:hypothetical protein
MIANMTKMQKLEHSNVLIVWNLPSKYELLSKSAFERGFFSI